MTGPDRPLMIGEFSRRCRLPVSTLRYYDKIGLLTPAAVDRSSGYRRYTRGQLATAVLISRLRAIGTAPCDISAVMLGGGGAAAVLVAERHRVQTQVREAQRALAEIDDLITGHSVHPAYATRPISLTPATVAAAPFHAPCAEITTAVLRGIAELRGALRRAGCERIGPWGAAFPLEITDEVSGFVFARTTTPVENPEIHTERLAATHGVQTFHHSSFDTVAMAYDAALNMIDDQGWRPTGPVVEEYLSLDLAPATTASIRLTVPIL